MIKHWKLTDYLILAAIAIPSSVIIYDYHSKKQLAEAELEVYYKQRTDQSRQEEANCKSTKTGLELEICRHEVNVAWSNDMKKEIARLGL